MNIELHHGDCLEHLPAIPSGSVDLILTDPPYFKVKDEHWDRQWDKPAQFLRWLDQVLEEFQRVLKPNGSLYIFASPQMASRVEVLISERFGVLNNIVWDKGRKSRMVKHDEVNRTFVPMSERVIFAEHRGADLTAGGHSGESFLFGPLVDYLRAERDAAGARDVDIDVACGWRTKAFHFFSRNMSNFILPTAENYASLQAAYPERFLREYSRLRDQFLALQTDFHVARRPFFITQQDQHTDIWSFNTVRSYHGRHPCEKPPAMLEHIIAASSRPGAVVLDAFMGTGSTGVACVNTGRSFIGIEKDAGYFEVARQRITGERSAPKQPTKPAPLTQDDRQFDLLAAL